VILAFIRFIEHSLCTQSFANQLGLLVGDPYLPGVSIPKHLLVFLTVYAFILSGIFLLNS
jgi:hypothetical protein